ncbi:MAG: hypothetical protein LBD20_03800, partial [Spirochaetaceae bacterium]|nr:hypothetical protein [Spirochaetaceae bacterium]
ELVNFVEHDFWKAQYNEKLNITKKYIDYFRKHNVDAIVLGCTHFLLLLDWFKEAAAPDITIFDSIDGVCRRTARLYVESAASGRKRASDRKRTSDRNTDANQQAGEAEKQQASKAAKRQAGKAADIFLTGGAPDEKWRDAAAWFSLRAAALF